MEYLGSSVDSLRSSLSILHNTDLLPTAITPANIMSTVLTMMKMVAVMPVEFDVAWQICEGKQA